MCRRLKDRMRGYFYKTKTALQASDLYAHSKNNCGKKLIDQFLADLKGLLESSKYNVDYFNRKADKKLRLCNERGAFDCGGLWNSNTCTYNGEHVINPYRSREERIIFQTWNLDHKIELSAPLYQRYLTQLKAFTVDILFVFYARTTPAMVGWKQTDIIYKYSLAKT